MIRVFWLVVVLLGCTSTPPPQSNWRTNVSPEGVQMAWEIKVWNPTKTDLKATYTPTNTGGIVGVFNWEVSSDGDCKRLTFDGKPSANVIGARDVMQLRLNDNGTWRDAFFGYAEIEPSRESNNRMTYIVLGFSQMFKTKPTKTRKFQGVTDLATVITQTGSSNVTPGGYRYDLPLAVNYNAAKIGSSLGALAFWDLRVITLGEALERVAGLSTSKVTYGVDATGDFFFRVPTGSKSLGYTTGRYDPEQINSSDIVTQANLIISTANPVIIASRTAPSNIKFHAPNTSTVGVTDFLGDPILYTHTDAAHSTYDAGQSYEIGLVNPFKSNFGWTATPSNMLDTANAFDGNPSTYAKSNSGTSFSLIAGEKTSKIIGFAVEYSTANTIVPTLSMTMNIVRWDGAVELLIASVVCFVTPTLDHTGRNRILVLLNYDGGDTVHKTYTRFDVDGPTAMDAVRIYSYEIIELDPTLLELAKSYIKTPATRAARFMIKGYQPPTATTHITGHPTLGTVVFNEQSVKSTWSAKRGLESTLVLGDRAISESARALRELVDAATRQSSTTTRGRR